MHCILLKSFSAFENKIYLNIIYAIKYTKELKQTIMKYICKKLKPISKNNNGKKIIAASVINAIKINNK